MKQRAQQRHKRLQPHAQDRPGRVRLLRPASGCRVVLTVKLLNRRMMKDFSSSWDIRATLMFFLKNGQQIGKLIGANKRELEKESASSR